MNVVLSAIIGGVAGLVKFFFTAHMENKKRKQEARLAIAGVVSQDRERASKVRDKDISFTRRTIAFTLVFTLCAPVWLSVFHPDSMMTVPQEFLERTFWDFILPWREGTKVTGYVTVPAPVMAMPIYDLAALIVGFYFGSGGSRAR